MIIEIVLGVVTSCGTLLVGNMFWSIHRRKQVIRMIFDDAAMLSRFVTPELLHKPPPPIERFAPPDKAGYASIAAFLAADRAAQRNGQILTGMILFGIIIGSAFLGLVYFVINLILFFLLLLGRPSQIAVQQAIEWVQIMAVLVWQWQQRKPDECATSIEKTGAPDLVILHAHMNRETA